MRSELTPADRLSVVVPVYNEAENIGELFNQLEGVLPRLASEFEIIFVNDGSQDGSEEILNEMFHDHPFVSVIHMYKNFGKTPALEQGFEIARGDIIATLDSDLQNVPEDLDGLVVKIREGYDLVSGQRQGRQDPRGKIMTSRIFNWIIRKTTGLEMYDYFSGMRCYRRKVLKALNLYGDLYRFALVFAHFDGFRVTEVPIGHHFRVHGDSKYSRYTRFKRGLSDLLIVLFTIKFNSRRVYLLGVWGAALTGLGFAFASLNIFLRLNESGGRGSVGLLSVGGILLFIGIQFLLFKKISDDFIRHHQTGREMRRKHIKEILRHPKTGGEAGFSFVAR